MVLNYNDNQEWEIYAGKIIGFNNTLEISANTVLNGSLNGQDASFNTVDIDGGTIDGTTIGVTNASSGSFTTLNSSGNITCANMTGTLLTPLQPNVESVGTLTSLTSSGNITGGSNSILSVASNTDTVHTIGNAKIGNLGFDDGSTGIKHKDQPVASYALLQGADGTLYSSSAAGRNPIWEF